MIRAYAGIPIELTYLNRAFDVINYDVFNSCIICLKKVKVCIRSTIYNES